MNDVEETEANFDDILGYQVQEFFQRVACVSYQMLVKQQLNPNDTSTVKPPSKTQLAVNLNSLNGKQSTLGYIAQQQSKDTCCSTV
jgi:hypothetical protein